MVYNGKLKLKHKSKKITGKRDSLPPRFHNPWLNLQKDDNKIILIKHNNSASLQFKTPPLHQY